jgi:hypothetical protein
MLNFHSKKHYMHMRDRELRDAQHIAEYVLPAVKGDVDEVEWTRHMDRHREQAAEYQRLADEAPE